jgi:hypothetical protein
MQGGRREAKRGDPMPNLVYSEVYGLVRKWIDTTRCGRTACEHGAAVARVGLSMMSIDCCQHTVWQSAQRQNQIANPHQKNIGAVNARHQGTRSRERGSLVRIRDRARLEKSSHECIVKVAKRLRRHPNTLAYSHVKEWHTADTAHESRCACTHLLQHGLHICGR